MATATKTKSKKAGKATTKAAPLRELDLNDLNHRAAELQKEMFDLRMNLTTKDQPDTSQVTKKRREYARILTILREKDAAQHDGDKKTHKRKATHKRKSAKKAGARKGGAKQSAAPSKKAASTKKSTAHKQTKHTRTKSG
ncbi:MAG TPA: 50S ribosomal protein L29 [Candidatus Sumerlaeota bacterium]|nr:50S ribosomal protein L29 [Candidatus Sumerlaeota bacterium]